MNKMIVSGRVLADSYAPKVIKELDDLSWKLLGQWQLTAGNEHFEVIIPEGALIQLEFEKGEYFI